MPVMTEQAKKRIRAESRISRALRKVREVLDFICYWLFMRDRDPDPRACNGGLPNCSDKGRPPAFC